MLFKFGDQLSAVHPEDGPQAGDQGNSPKDYEQPTDDGDGEWALFHDQRLTRFVSAATITSVS